MTADTHEELIEMAELIGMRLKWIQDRGTPKEHFDLSPGRRALALKYGAVERSERDWARAKRSQEKGLTSPEERP